MVLNTINEILKIKKHEKVLVLTDKGMKSIANLFLKAAKKLSNNVDLLKIKPTGRNGAEPSISTAKKMKQYDILILATSYSLTHTNARRNACKTGARAASLPHFEKKMLPTLKVNYKEMQKLTKKVARKLQSIKAKNQKLHITSPSGTNLTLEIGPRVISDVGIIKKGEVNNLPAGEVFFAPKNTNGILVFNLLGKQIKKLTKIIIKNNKITNFQNSKEGNVLKKILNVRNGKYVAEFGIGTNSKAKIIGNILQDEKALGTSHIAFGDNISMGGKNNSSVHQDVIIFKPTITINNKTAIRNKTIMLNGKIK